MPPDDEAEPLDQDGIFQLRQQPVREHLGVDHPHPGRGRQALSRRLDRRHPRRREPRPQPCRDVSGDGRGHHQRRAVVALIGQLGCQGDHLELAAAVGGEHETGGPVYARGALRAEQGVDRIDQQGRDPLRALEAQALGQIPGRGRARLARRPERQVP